MPDFDVEKEGEMSLLLSSSILLIIELILIYLFKLLFYGRYSFLFYLFSVAPFFFIITIFTKYHLYPHVRNINNNDKLYIYHDITTAVNSFLFSLSVSILRVITDDYPDSSICYLILIYYILDLIFNANVIKLEFIIHHILILFGGYSLLYTTNDSELELLYNCLTLEFSTILLTVRQFILTVKKLPFLNQVKRNNRILKFYNKLLLVVEIAFVSMFFTVRIIYFTIVSINIYTRLDRAHGYSLIGLCCLNVYWGGKIIVNALSRTRTINKEKGNRKEVSEKRKD